MATLILEDGSRFEGKLFGRRQPVTGEVVFATGMCGYQEMLTDPAYAGQIVCMTYPLIGNVGINDLDDESNGAKIAGMVVSELCELPSNWQMKKSLDSYLDEQGVTGICGVDTRALTRHLRTASVMTGRIVDSEGTQEDVQACKDYQSENRVADVTCAKAYEIEGEGDVTLAVLDLGVKKGLLRYLAGKCAKIKVYPASTKAQEILDAGCDGVFVSGGPGNPMENPEIAACVKTLMEEKPVMGVCLGHLMMAAASGCTIEKMRFGHHGSNQPVKDLARGTCAVTGQSHGYVVSEQELPANVTVSHVNWNDRSVEGLRYAGTKAFSVQFTPGMSGGAFDTTYLYDDFFAMVRTNMTK